MKIAVNNGSPSLPSIAGLRDQRRRDARIARAAAVRVEAVEQRWMLSVTSIDPATTSTLTRNSTPVVIHNSVPTSLSGTLAAVAATEGTSFSGTVATFTDTNTVDSASNFRGTIDWGDGTTTTGVVPTGGSGTFTVSGTHTYADGQDGPQAVSVTLSQNQTGTIKVYDSTSNALVGYVNKSFAYYGEYVANASAANALDVSFNSGSSPFQMTETNNSSSSSHPYVGAITGYLNSSSSLGSGNYNYTFLGGTDSTAAGATPSSGGNTFTDAEPSHGPRSIESTIWSLSGSNALTPQWVNPDSSKPPTYVVYDPSETDDLFLTGDVAAFNAQFASFSGTSSLAYLTFVPDSSAASGNASGTVTVQENADTFQVTAEKTISGAEGSPFSGAVAEFSDIGTAPASDYTASINWGDGTTTAGTVSGSGGGYTVAGAHTYTDEGTFTVSTTVAEPEANYTASAVISTATIADADTLAAANAQPTPTVPEGSTLSGAVAVFTDAGYPGNSSSDFTASVNWGDGTTTGGTVSGGSGANFTVSGSHAYAGDEGSYTARVTLADDAPGTATGTVTNTVTVTDADILAADIIDEPTLLALEGSSLSGAVAVFTDAGYPGNSSSDFAASINWGDGTTTAGTVSGGSGANLTVSGAHTYADEGFYSVAAMLADDAPGTARGIAANTAAVLEADTLAAAGTQPTLIGPEGHTLSGAVAVFTDAGYPGNSSSDFAARINWGDGTTTAGTVSGGSGANFTVSGSHAYAGDETTYTATATLAEDAPGTDSYSIINTVSLTEADTLAAAGAQPTLTVPEGSTLSGAVAVFTDAGYPGNSSSDFTASVNWGDGTTTAGTVSGGSGANFTVSGSHAYAGDEGSYIATVTLADDAPGTATGTVTNTVTVSEADTLAPSSSPQTFIINEGGTISSPLATFSDTYTANTASDFTARIDWGNGTTTTGNVSGGTGSFTVSATTGAAGLEEGLHNIKVTLADDSPGTAKATLSESVLVIDAPLTATPMSLGASENTPFSNVAIASFTDADPNGAVGDYIATIDWGDGSSTQLGSVKSNGSGGFNVLGTHTYAEEGTYHPVVAIHDGGTGTSAISTVNVADPAVLATGGLSYASTEGGLLGTSKLATFTDPGGAESTADYAAVVKWGDGTTTSGTVTFHAGLFTVSGSHSYAEEGIYHPSVVVHHESAPDSIAVSDTVSVYDAALSAAGTTQTALEGRVAAGAVATFTDANAGAPIGDFTATIAWGDGQTTSGMIVKDSSGHFHVTGPGHAYAEQGKYSVHVSIHDIGGSSTSANSVVNVAEAPLDTPSGLTLNKARNVTFTNLALGTFRDQDALNTLPGDYVVTINWGDGSAATTGKAVFLSATPNVGSYWSVQGTHKYTAAKSYTVKIYVYHDNLAPLIINSIINVN